MLQMTNTWNEFPKVLCNSNVQNQKIPKKLKIQKIPKKQCLRQDPPVGGGRILVFLVFLDFFFFIYLFFWYFWYFWFFLVFLFFWYFWYFCFFVFLFFLVFLFFYFWLIIYLFIYYHVLCKMYWNMSFLCSIFTVNMHEILVCGGSRGGDHIYIYILIDCCLLCFCHITILYSLLPISCRCVKSVKTSVRGM